MRKILVTIVLLMATVGWSGAIKQWAAGDTLSPTDINANFTHIHGSMVGGHGGRLVNADVNSSANISYTKLQNGRGLPRAFARIAGSCACPCTTTLNSSLNVTSIACTGTGVYQVTLNYTASNTAYAALAQSEASANICEAVPTSTTVTTVNCYTRAAGAAADSAFDVIVLDND